MDILTDKMICDKLDFYNKTIDTLSNYSGTNNMELVNFAIISGVVDYRHLIVFCINYINKDYNYSYGGDIDESKLLKFVSKVDLDNDESEGMETLLDISDNFILMKYDKVTLKKCNKFINNYSYLLHSIKDKISQYLKGVQENRVLNNTVESV